MSSLLLFHKHIFFAYLLVTMPFVCAMHIEQVGPLQHALNALSEEFFDKMLGHASGQCFEEFLKRRIERIKKVLKKEENQSTKHELYKALLSPRGSDSLSSKSNDCSDIMLTHESVSNLYIRFIRYKVAPLFICHHLGCYSEEMCPTENLKQHNFLKKISNKSFMKKLENVEQAQKEDLVIEAHVTFAQMQVNKINRIRSRGGYLINGLIL